MPENTPTKPKGLPGAQVGRASELVNYQDGAVVSREIVKKPTGNVTLFAFDDGQGLSEHTAPSTHWPRLWKERRKSSSPGSPTGCAAAR